MKVVQLLGKAWLETTVLFSSMAYLIIRIMADINKIHLPTWFESFDLPTISLFLVVFILLYRGQGERKGDQFSKDLIEYESDYLALGIGNLLNIINPECIVISGGISLAGDEILLPIKEKLKKYTMPPALENLEIKVGVLGNEAGIKGAVALFI